VTCHTTVVEEMGDYNFVGGSLVEDANLITAAGAGVSIEFALAIAERLVDSETLSRVREGMELE
jgi:transcriptional regulator GlxA family with amidase domain